MAIKQVPLAETHRKLGARMVEFAGYEMPIRYSSLVEEHLTVREQVGLFDVSHMGEFLINGPQALNLIQKCTSNDASKLVDGQAQYSCLVNANGGIIDDLLIYRIEHDQYLVVVNASNIEKDWDWLNQHKQTLDVSLDNISDHICLLAVQGPLAAAALQDLTKVDLSAQKYYTFSIGTFAETPEVIISATGYTGSGGFELYIPAAQASKVWNEIMESGSRFGLKPIGLGARDTLRLEKGYCLYGNDIDHETSPLEAGLGWITKLHKDFIGSDVLRKQKEHGITKKLCGFTMDEKGIPRKDYRILDAEGHQIGVVTSGSQSPCLNNGIGLGYLTMEHAKPENNIFIEIRKKPVKATIKKLPMV